MLPSVSHLAALAASLGAAPTVLAALVSHGTDPCTKIAGKTFMSPPDALACMRSFPFNETLRQNVLQVVSRVFDFYTFEDYYLNSPPPFQDSTVNIRAELARINRTSYKTDFDFNLDLFNFVNGLNDGHTQWQPGCYIQFQNILPAPMVSLAETATGLPSVFIAPDSVPYLSQFGPDFISYFESIHFDWKALAGARVVLIEGIDPFAYAELVAKTQTGRFLDLGQRVASTFSTYGLINTNFTQRLGDIAGAQFPTQESLTLTLIPAGSVRIETVKVPYVANYVAGPFTDGADFWANNCAAKPDTNGVDLKLQDLLVSPLGTTRKHAKGIVVDTVAQPAPLLPPQFQPTLALLNGSDDAMKSYILPDGKTGVIFAGSFEPNDFDQWERDLQTTFTSLKEGGATQLVVDVTGNQGGFICLGQYLHGYLSGTKLLGAFSNMGFESTHRANPLAKKIVASDIELGLIFGPFYPPANWAFFNNTELDISDNYLADGTSKVINGQIYQEGRRVGDFCPAFIDFPDDPPFDLSKVIIVTNSWCGSTCAMFTTLMHERHNTPIVVFGGNALLPIQYKGTAGNQVLEWTDIDTEVKTANLKDDPLAPPDLLVAADMRHNWRTAYSFLDETVPIAYKSELPTHRFAYTADTYNNPENVWKFIAKTFFG
ncbi:hypothetical protein C2E23DRAFT_841425 [Lenzites betulinus]|nr:hypothetical protein C2E23DRAFT_841425 [Lenzites betulinus]